MELGYLKTLIVDQAKAHGKDELSLERRALYLVSETGEVAKEVLRLADPWQRDIQDIRVNALGKELSDIVWNCFVMAEMLGLELDECIVGKIAELEDRWKRIISQ
ncbi:hypothetical protein D3C71_743420 [compost metagenome]